MEGKTPKLKQRGRQGYTRPRRRVFREAAVRASALFILESEIGRGTGLKRGTLFVVVAAFAISCGSPENVGRPPLPSPTRVDTLQLKAVIESYRDKKAVMVNVWATWCVPCVKEFPYLVELQKKYSDQLHVIFVSADFPEQDTAARVFLFRQGVEWETYLKDAPDEPFIRAMSEEWSGALPATFVYDREGRPAGFWEGAVDSGVFDEYARKVIGDFNQRGGKT